MTEVMPKQWSQSVLRLFCIAMWVCVVFAVISVNAFTLFQVVLLGDQGYRQW